MSMGGSFFNRTEDTELENLMLVEHSLNRQTELSMIKNGIENHLFDTHELLSIYDKLSEHNKREFFQGVVVAFIKFKFQEDTME